MAAWFAIASPPSFDCLGLPSSTTRLRNRLRRPSRAFPSLLPFSAPRSLVPTGRQRVPPAATLGSVHSLGRSQLHWPGRKAGPLVTSLGSPRERIQRYRPPTSSSSHGGGAPGRARERRPLVRQGGKGSDPQPCSLEGSRMRAGGGATNLHRIDLASTLPGQAEPARPETQGARVEPARDQLT